MKKISFFRVLKNNLECAFCREKNCPARYYPNKKVMILGLDGIYHPKVCRKVFSWEEKEI